MTEILSFSTIYCYSFYLSFFALSKKIKLCWKNCWLIKPKSVLDLCQIVKYTIYGNADNAMTQKQGLSNKTAN